MPEAVLTGPRPFAPLARGTYPRVRRHTCLGSPMHTPQPTSTAPSHARPAARGRRSKLALAGVLVLLVLLVAAAPAAAFSTDYAFTITGHGWGHGVGMSQWGAYGYAKHGWEYKAILKHYYTGIAFTTVADSTIRVHLRSGLSAVKLTCRRRLHGAGLRRRHHHPGRHHGHRHLHQPRLPRGRRFAAQDLHRRADVHAHHRRAQAHHHDRPRRRRRVPRHHPGRAQRQRAHDDQPRAAGELPARRRAARGALRVADGGAQGAGLRGTRVRARQPAARPVLGRVLRRARPGLRRRRHRKDRTDAAVKATAGVCPTYNGKPIVAVYFSCSGGHTENVKYVWGGVYPYLKGVDDPYDYYGTLHDWGPLRRTPAQVGGPLGAAGIAARRLHGQARHLAAHRQGRDHRQQRHQVHRRRLPAHEARAQQHLGGLHEHGHHARPPATAPASARAAASRSAGASTRRWPTAPRCACTTTTTASGTAAASPPRASRRACPAATRPGTPCTASRSAPSDHQVLLLERQGQVAGHHHPRQVAARSSSRSTRSRLPHAGHSITPESRLYAGGVTVNHSPQLAQAKSIT